MATTAPLLTRMRVIKVALEAVDARGGKIAGTAAMTVFDLEINPTSPFEERRDVGLYRGPSLASGIVSGKTGKCSFKTELRGTGVAGALDPGLAALVQACGLKKAAEVYQVGSAAATDLTVSIDVWEHGQKKGLAGASGNVKFGGVVGERMFLDFEFDGTWQAPIDEALPAFEPSTKTAVFIRSGTFTIATLPLLIGNFELDMGNTVVPRRDAAGVGGIAYHMIPDFAPVLTIDPESDNVAHHDFYGLWLAGTPAAVSLVLTDGAAAPLDIITFTLLSVICKEISEGDRDGVAVENYVGQCQHTASGNDSVKIEVTTTI